MATVLLVDDNDLDRKIARDSLQHAGFEVAEAADGAAGLRALYDSHPDVVVLDVLMPAMDGWTVCQRVRELSSVPIIMLTSLDREEEMVRGLDLGADDFLAKPISPMHLAARVRAILRRTGESAPEASPGLVYHDEALSIDVSTHTVLLNGEPVDLTPTEFRLLVALAENAGKVQGTLSLLSNIWGPEYVDDVDFLRVYVWRLRKKLEHRDQPHRWIHTERGFGYRFALSFDSTEK